jgi:NAD(P)H-flavin reductase
VSGTLRAADAGDRRRFLLLYGSLRWDEVTFREELERLRWRLELRVVHVLTEPPPGWQGETGFIDAALLERHLPPNLGGADVFVCGPPPCSPPRSRTSNGSARSPSRSTPNSS